MTGCEVLPLYERHAEAFDAARDGSLFERSWLDAFHALLPGPNLLDLGCGTGVPIAAYLIEQGCRVHGIDGAPAMVARATARFPDQTWQVADMRALPPLPRFDGVLAWHSLFHLPPDDQRRLLARLATLTGPGAAVLFTTGPAAGETTGTFQGAPLYHASLSPTAYHGILRDQGFDIARQSAQDPTCGGATVWLAQKRR